MALIDELEVIDGYFQDNRFIMRGIGGHAVYGKYKSEGLRSMARLINNKVPLTIVIDKEREIFIPVKFNERLKQELYWIAEELDEMN